MTSVILFCSLMIGTSAMAGTLNIVATGDSNTTGYAPNRLTLAMQAQGLTGVGYSIASGGATAPLYVGNELDTNHHPSPAFHNQAHDAINGPVYGFGPPWTYGSVIENNPDPYAVIVMLGTNDAFRAAAGNAKAWDDYRLEMDGVYQYLATSGKEVFVATPIPLLGPQNSKANDFLNSTMIPWIKEKVIEYDLHLIDLNADIQQQPNYMDWYSDGIHLFGDPAGYAWMASEVLFATLDTHLGDANWDGHTDGLDYIAWADHFGGTGNWSQGDFNHDGIVDGLDYVLWADHYDASSAAVIVPEPSTMTALLIVAGFMGSLYLVIKAVIFVLDRTL